jgi:4-hydroxy-tetrahydrodipicolinate reductase
MSSVISLGVSGAAGRMGRRVIALVATDPNFQLVTALEKPGHPQLGQDAGLVAGVGELRVPITCQWPETCKPQVWIDFSAPEAVPSLGHQCVERGVALVCATTGLSSEQLNVLKKAAEKIPVLWSPNMSLMVNLAMNLAATVATALAGRDVDVEIIERHHRFKEDAPSGTALKFGQIISEKMGQSRAVHGRQGRPGPRPRDEIGYHAVRVGDDPGQHTIIFALLGEVLELTVRAMNRDAYVQGALAAARFLVGRAPGFYSMSDVLWL